MSRVVHPDFQRGQRVEPYRPNFLRRTISRYQLVELFVIIGIILMVWGALSLGRVSTALKAPSGWLDSVRIEILDGDTIRSGRQIYRLVGFNTPESGANAQARMNASWPPRPRNGFANLQPAPNSTSGGSLVPARVAPKAPDNAIMGGYAAR
jgi:hypothetical protein